MAAADWAYDQIRWLDNRTWQRSGLCAGVFAVNVQKWQSVTFLPMTFDRRESRENGFPRR